MESMGFFDDLANCDTYHNRCSKGCPEGDGYLCSTMSCMYGD